MNFTVICFIKGRRNIFRYFYPEPIVTIEAVLFDFQKDYLSHGYHPADINWLEIYDHVAQELTTITHQTLGNKPLYFHGGLS